MSGYEMEEVVGKNGRVFQGPKTDRRSVMEIREAIRQEKSMQISIVNYRRDGTPFWMLFCLCPVFGKNDERVVHFVSVQGLRENGGNPEYYYEPGTGRKFRSLVFVQRYLAEEGENAPLSLMFKSAYHVKKIICSITKELYGLGARKIGVATLPPLGCLPALITIFGSDSNECVTKLNKAAISFNNKLNVTSRNSLNKLSNLASQNLRRVLEESAPVLVTARHDAEERRTNICLSEEQDAASRATALEADQAMERLLNEEQEQLAREAAEAERKHKEEEEAREREAHESAEKEAALARLRQEKALSLVAEPEKGPDVTRVLVRFPTGERKDRRFHNAATIQSLYDFVDSLGCLKVESYSIASNFPRIVYGPDELSMSQKEAGLHTQASLFVELSS